LLVARTKASGGTVAVPDGTEGAVFDAVAAIVPAVPPDGAGMNADAAWPEIAGSATVVALAAGKVELDVTGTTVAVVGPGPLVQPATATSPSPTRTKAKT